MAITYVGGVQGGRAGATSTTTQSLSGTLTGGVASSPSTGDIVVVLCAAAADTTAAPSQDISGNNSGAYVGLTAQSSVVATTYDTYQRVSYQIQGGTVDTSITIPSSGSIRNAQRWIVHVFRNVDSTTPMDVTATYATGTGTGRPNPAAINPTTAGAWICAFYASAAATGAAYTAPTDFATDWLGGTTADTADIMTGGGYYTGWTSGSYDPAAITAGGTTNAADTWAATTIALRPAPTQVTVTHTTDALKYAQLTKTHTTDSYLLNSPPTVALNSPADAGSTSDTTPDLSFTGTDANGNDIRYNIQIHTDNTFGSEALLEENLFTANNSSGFTSYSEIAQSFVGDGNKITKISVELSNTGSPTGNIYAKLYAHSGTFGTSSVPTGSVLATSNAVNVTSISSQAFYDFTFSGAEQYQLGNGTNYVIVIDVSGVSNKAFFDFWDIQDDTGMAGNSARFSGSWIADSGSDLSIKIYTLSAPLFDKISGTDAGFSGSPDNSDPFSSGQQVTYTVQSTLTAGTYYWRVRGIDPSGSNTYGSWATTRSFTVNDSSVTITHTTSSYLWAQKTRTHTADSLKYAQFTRTHTTDAYKYSQSTKTHTTNSYLLAQKTRTHTADALKYAQFTRTHTTDGLKYAQFTRTHTTDSYLLAQKTRTHTTDSYLWARKTATHTADALKYARLTVIHTGDSLLYVRLTRTHTTDSYLEASATAGTVSHTTSSYLYAQLTRIHTTDSLLFARNTEEHTTNALLQARKTVTHTGDSLLLARKTSVHTTDALKFARLAVGHTSDALKYGRYTQTHTTDAFKYAQLTVTHGTNAYAYARLTVSHTADSLLSNGTTQFTVNHSTDSLLHTTTPPPNIILDIKTGNLLYRISNKYYISI